jgi:CHRD domain-containing protein
MPTLRPSTKWRLLGAFGMAVLIAGGCASQSATSTGMPITRLTGGQEVPPVGGGNLGTSDIAITLTKCPSSGTSLSCPQAFGTVTVTGFMGTAAHIHRGKAGQNGPVIVTLTKTGENSWAVPDRTFISDSDYGAYNDNELYINVHSANNANGEVRGQLRPTP